MYAEQYCRTCGHRMEHHTVGGGCALCTQRKADGRPPSYYAEACVDRQSSLTSKE